MLLLYSGNIAGINRQQTIENHAGEIIRAQAVSHDIDNFLDPFYHGDEHDMEALARDVLSSEAVHFFMYHEHAVRPFRSGTLGNRLDRHGREGSVCLIHREKYGMDDVLLLLLDFDGFACPLSTLTVIRSV
jgi:hypothetical protein